MTQQRQTIGFILSLLLMAVALMPACAEQSATVQFGSNLRSALRQLESVSARPGEATVSDPLLDTDQYNIQMAPLEQMSFSRKFTRSQIDTKASLLGLGYEEKTETSAVFNLTGSTAFTYSDTQSQNSIMEGSLLGSSSVTAMGLRHGFGSGTRAGSLSFSRNRSAVSTGTAAAVNTSTDAWAFGSGLGKDRSLSLRSERIESDKTGGYAKSTEAAELKLHFSGGPTPWRYTTTSLQNGTNQEDTEKLELAVPYMLGGRKGMAEYVSNLKTVNGTPNDLITWHLAVPMKLFGQAGTLDHTTREEDQGAGVKEARTTKIVNPFYVAGRKFGAEETFVTVDQSGTATDTRGVKFTAPVAGVQAVLERQTVTQETSTGETSREQVAMTLPSVKLTNHMSAGWQRITTDDSAATPQEVTKWNMTAQPLSPLRVEARYACDECSTQVTRTRNIQSRLALGRGTALSGTLTETEVSGATPTGVTHVVLTREQGKSHVGLTAAMAQFDTSAQASDDARRVEVKLGGQAQDRLAVKATYSEYDPNHMVNYGEDALIALDVTHAPSRDTTMRWRYEDQPSRLAPLRAMDVALPALGGAFQLSYANNPTSPDGKVVRLADQYSASLERKLAGGLNMQLGYRYLDYGAAADADQYLKVQLFGGKEAGRGKLAIAYMTGDYCTGTFRQKYLWDLDVSKGDFCQPRTSSTTPPGTLLGVTFSRTWGDNGLLKLYVQHSTPSLVSDEGDTEGQLRLSTVF